MPRSLAVIGGGNMAQAILDGAVRAGVLEKNFVVADPSPERRKLFPNAVERASEAIAWLCEHESAPGRGQVLLAVKPQMLPEVVRDLRGALESNTWGEHRVVISILAGATIAHITEAFAGRARVIRVMPNTPALVGRGMAAICPAPDARESDVSLARSLFNAVGRVIDLREDQMDAFTAVAGSGPAYVFRLAEAMVEGAIKSGLNPDEALLAVRETIAGAGLLLAGSNDPPGVLRERVTSKGGTTAAALEIFERARFGETVIDAIAAATARGAELSALASRKTSSQ
ncbi:MAG: pyrroline-5-carboxylate reductase [Planctomycetota bacterium]|nr:MAG: pyrroline-5-carboxylate reductase [Planctomycetota bacterium]